MSLPNELYSLESSQLLALLDVYYVRNQNGQQYSGNKSVESILNFISDWLRLSSEDETNAQAHRYLESEDKKSYFYQLTGQPSSNFLNDKERVFFLTHGYGKPNKNISMSDAELRTFYSNANSTALIALSDILGACPTRQNPDVIRELLGDINLKSIDKFHKGAVKIITDCLSSKDSLGPNRNKVQCFERFLLSVGMIPIFEYDPFHNVYISNISQLNEYSAVEPDKVWNFEEVRNMPDLIVDSVIRLLPDTQILEIAVSASFGEEMRYEDTLDLSVLRNRLRGKLVEGAINFLTYPQYYINGNTIFYGRLIDDTMKTMTFGELNESIVKYGALIDPFDNPIDPYSVLQEVIDRNILNKTRSYAIENKNIINTIADKDRLREIFENSNDLDHDLQGRARKLILWSRRKDTDDWFPVSINFDEYFKLWEPLFGNIISDTIKYYKSIL